jgi:hypothetical protein
MELQITKLHACTHWAAKNARDRKAALRMLLDAEELQLYLKSAFDHYSKTLDFPFDFVEATFTHNRIPLDFGGNILKLAISMKEQTGHGNSAHLLFRKLSFMVASCIMLDSVRRNVKGKLQICTETHFLVI